MRSKKLRQLDVEKENEIVNKIYDEKNLEAKRKLVIEYINNDVIVDKRKNSYLLEAQKARNNTQLDYLVTNITLAGRGNKLVKQNQKYPRYW